MTELESWYGIEYRFDILLWGITDWSTMIRFEKIDENTKNLEDIKHLYMDAFPFEERIPFYIMVSVGNDRGVEFLSIYPSSVEVLWNFRHFKF